LVVSSATGCATTGRPGEIPLGQWSGHGTFVYEHWKPKQGDSEGDEQVSLTRDYPTTLTIKPGTLDGSEIVEMEIVSKRGELPGDSSGDETHLIVALTEAKRVSNSIVLYRIRGAMLNPGPDEKLESDDSAPPISASCTVVGDATVLQIQYAENFVDTFRFRGRHVEKTGIWFVPDEGLVHWREQLDAQF